MFECVTLGESGSVVYVTRGDDGGVEHVDTPATGDAKRGQQDAHDGRRGLGLQWWQWRCTTSSGSRSGVARQRSILVQVTLYDM